MKKIKYYTQKFSTPIQSGKNKAELLFQFREDTFLQNNLLIHKVLMKLRISTKFRPTLIVCFCEVNYNRYQV